MEAEVMGILKNWKAGRAARIEAALSRKSNPVKQPQIPKTVNVANKLTKQITDVVMLKLEGFGIGDHNERVHCSAEIFQETARHFKRIQLAGKATDDILLEWTNSLKAILSKYGMADNTQQELFILDYLMEIEKVS